jgi:lipoprotein-anchoring transpeptidase ErfK/SrfK
VLALIGIKVILIPLFHEVCLKKFVQPLFASLLICTLPACEINVNTDDQDTDVDATDGVSGRQQAEKIPVEPSPAEGFNEEAAERATQLALRSGTEEQRSQAREQASREFEGLRVEVDLSDRKLRIFQGDELTATHDVAIGTEKWPTPTGSWEFHRVDLNPEWNPPKTEEWAEDEERQAPGSADNPMGRARLVYRMPNTVHGTDDINSLGKASSHGSIRVANKVVLQMAETLLKAGGSFEGSQWFQKMKQSRTKEYQIPLGQKIPIKVQE